MTKPTKWYVHPRKTQISLGIRPVWLESSLSKWRKLGSLATHWAHSEDWSDWVDAQTDLSFFAGCTLILLVLSWGGSLVFLVSGICIPIWTLFSIVSTELKCMSHVMRKPVYAMCEQQKRRSACASMQSDQRLVVRCLDSILPLVSVSRLASL